MLKVRNWLVLSSGWALSLSISSAWTVSFAQVGDFGSDSVQPFHPILISPSKQVERQAEKNVPPMLAGRWEMVKTIPKPGPTSDVIGGHNYVDVGVQLKGVPEWKIVHQRSGKWTIAEGKAAYPLIVDKVEGVNIFARFQHSRERHALTLSFLNDSMFNGLERIILLDKKGVAMQEKTKVFSIVGCRVQVPKITKLP